MQSTISISAHILANMFRTGTIYTLVDGTVLKITDGIDDDHTPIAGHYDHWQECFEMRVKGQRKIKNVIIKRQN